MHVTKDKMKMLGRLKKRSDFLRAGSSSSSSTVSAKKWISKTVILQVVDNGLDETRFGITVTKKTFKAAVDRNRIKRRLRAAAYQALSEGGQAGYDYVLIGRRETLSCPYATLASDLAWCLRRLHAQGVKK